MKDMFNMFGKVREMESKLKEAQEQLAEVIAEGESGGGMVRAVANGKKQIISLEIDPDICKPEDKKMLEDLTVAAINKALDAAEEKSKAFMQNHMQSVMPNIPGMDMSQFMK